MNVSDPTPAISPPPAKRCVLIGFGESLAGPECAWSLLDAGFDVHVFVRRGKQAALRHSRSVQVSEIIAPELDADQCMQELSSLVQRLRPAALLPMDDAAVWTCARIARQLHAPVVGPTDDLATLALDKRRQVAAASEAGLATPATQWADDANELSPPSTYPVVLKPALAMDCRNNRLDRGGHQVCANEQEWHGAVERMRDAGPVMMQPFIAGVGEGVFGLATDDGVLAFSSHRRVRMMNPAGSGSSACIAQSVDAHMRSAVQRLIEQTGWRGLFMVELLCDAEGRRWFMELNGRTWGSMALARQIGLEYPAWAVQLTLDHDYRPPVDTPTPEGASLLCRHLGRELVHLLMVMRGPRSQALTAWPSRWRTVRELLRVRRSDRWYNWRRGERRVFLADAWQTLISQCFKRKAQG